MSTPTYNFADEPLPQTRSRRSSRRGGSSRSGTSRSGHNQRVTVEGQNESNLQSHFSQQPPPPPNSNNSNINNTDKPQDVDNTDGNGSLTYSASSSINSHSTAGESTDSSFSGIMKVLDLDEDADLERLMSKGDDGPLTAQQRELLLERHAQQQQRERREMQSCNGHRHHREDSSLQYSTDYTDDTTNSPLDFLTQTIPGQPSDSHANDGGGFGANEQGIVFAPANPSSRRSKDRNKKKFEKLEKINSSNSSVASQNSRGSQRSQTSSSRGSGGAAASSGSNSRNNAGGSNPTRFSSGRSRSDPISGTKRTSSKSSTNAAAAAANLVRTHSIGSSNDPQKVLDAFANQSPPPRGASRALDKERPQQLWYKQWWMCGFTDALNFQDP
mmetsp:Transcript_20343/g.25155  ORF Transcript_20343/g.25155 Transcript_20343/m.25155 type:complete len:386 (-) Transcript_20343:77-1234(-)|eukprot:CAMPEP_0172499544 /NCGR_PEP_ID=MMETSP1066-20121228/128215_1 /TAXON_ID=671091 /ORGANISM="Coscinodiscus wailesii, Strain CCMP2513" /LENGTH=385 /DNA_ID=CAMNT_0013273329 /DNA_START=115 /DNA_END=1272 /DNA_ORIENTATION=-